MNNFEKAAWDSVDTLDPEAAAHYLSGGEPLLKRTILSHLERDYAETLWALYREADWYSKDKEDRLPRDSEPHPEAATHPLRSIALDDAQALLVAGDPYQAFAWASSDAGQFERQSFTPGSLRAWIGARSVSGIQGEPTLVPKEKTALYKVIAVLAIHAELDLSRHSSAAAVLELANAGRVDISKRTLEKHLREAFNELGQGRTSDD